QRELAEVNKSNAVEMAMIDAEKKVKDAERTRELTEVDKQKAIETANQEKAMTVAVAQAKRADAEREQFTKMALREKAAQDVETVKVTSAAEREGDQKLIAASKAAEQDLVREQRKADGAAYTIQKEAEAKKAAAQAEYEARLKAAEAESESAKKRAEGAQAEQMVAVHVQQKLVEVEQQKVEVESRRLEVQEKFGKAAIELQVRLKEIEASAQIEVERARAMGAMLSRGEFTIYGDPTTFARMMEAFSKGASIRQTVEGFLAEKGTDDNLSRVVNAAAEVIGKVTGKSKKADGGPGAEKA
ncbi:MAG: hypothetical protein HY303_14180, partial [Candidatus Wallbacteria bacterium]|nr:hypothetical protein [Candidatus Wallbacteria bacterium]